MFCRSLSRILRTRLIPFQWCYSCSPASSSALVAYYQSSRCSNPEINSPSTSKDQLDPFSLVADELSLVADRLRSMVVAEVPKLASAAEYFFKMGVEGKRFRPTVLLLMATALNIPVSMSSTDNVSPVRVVDELGKQLRRRHQCIADFVYSS